MTPERWMSLSYPEKKKALVEAVCEEECWDWADAEVWQAFFDENDEANRRLRRFVDVRRLRTFYGDRELDDGFADLGMDAYQYQYFTNKIFENLPRTLQLNSESFELALLDSMGATFVTIDTVYIRTHDVYGDYLELKFTRKVYSDGRCDEFFGPFEPEEVHEVIDEEGDWMEASTGVLEDGTHDDAEPDTEPEDQADYVPDLPDIPDADKDMELRLTMGYAEDEEMSIPGYDEDTDSPERGLGDALYE
jgi:hypothetical protein